jgi:hypothetical protein
MTGVPIPASQLVPTVVFPTNFPLDSDTLTPTSVLDQISNSYLTALISLGYVQLCADAKNIHPPRSAWFFVFFEPMITDPTRKMLQTAPTHTFTYTLIHSPPHKLTHWSTFELCVAELCLHWPGERSCSLTMIG